MENKKIFKRYELKYLMSEQQAEKLHRIMQVHMKPDAFGRSRVGSIYFDTEDHLLIRRSIERPVYKEKLRIRYYGDRTAPAQMFLELKKKGLDFGKEVYTVGYARDLLIKHLKEREGH